MYINLHTVVQRWRGCELGHGEGQQVRGHPWCRVKLSNLPLVIDDAGVWKREMKNAVSTKYDRNNTDQKFFFFFFYQIFQHFPALRNLVCGWRSIGTQPSDPVHPDRETLCEHQWAACGWPPEIWEKPFNKWRVRRIKIGMSDITFLLISDTPL